MTSINGNKPNIWQRIGTTFKKGWNNGNIAKGVSAVGMTMFSVGMTGAMIHDMNRSNKHCCGSIWGNSWGGAAFGGCSSNMGWMNIYNNPMAMFNNMGETNPYLTAAGRQNAFNYGYQLGLQYMMQQPQMIQQSFINPNSTSINRGNKDAGAIASDTTAEKGKKFDEETNALKDKNSGKTETVFSRKVEGEDKKTTYKNDIKALAQSYIKHIDEDGNGYISEEEFIEHEIENFKKENPNATPAKIEQCKLVAKEAFAQMNLNKNKNGLDWKEMSATLAAYDAGGNSDGTLDGKITTNEHKSSTSALADSKFGNVAWSFYQKLFPDE